MTEQPKQIPVWVQVADAGFGAAVEAHGFRRVGKAMWRRDGGGLSWRIALVRAPGTPDAFLIQQGCAAIGLDDLVKTVSDDLPSERMTGTSFRVHSNIEIVSWAGYAIEKAMKAAWVPPPRPQGFWKRFLWQPPKPPKIDRAEVARRIPFCVLTEEGEDPYALGTRDARIADVATVAADIWRQQGIRYLEENPDYRALYQRIWGPEGYKRDRIEDAGRYCAAKMAGDQATIEWMARQVFDKVAGSAEAQLDRLRKTEDFKKYIKRKNHISPLQIAEREEKYHLEAVNELKEWASLLEIKLPDR